MLTAKDIAHRLSISLASAYALLRSGQIRRYKGIGGVRCTEQALAEYIERQTEKPVERVLVETRSSHFEF
jgi:predicted site-specific integrase-resolvase